MSELIESSDASPTETSSDLVVYEPGLPAKDVLKGVLGRFLPGSVAGLGVLMLVLGLPGGFSADFILIRLFGIVALLCVGFGVGLEGMRRWLYPDAEITGRRSFVAGLMASLGATIGLASSVMNTPQALTAFFGIGLVLAVAMFFAWLSPTPEEMRLQAGERSLDDRDG